jgi:hypothetical protein
VIVLGGLACKSKSSENEIDVDKVIATAPRFPIGHKVRIASTPTTQAAGVAGRTGTLAGFTTPSQTGENIIGEPKDDIAFGVEFKNPDALMWLPPELIEFTGRTSDLDITIYGQRWLWRSNGTLDKSLK